MALDEALKQLKFDKRMEDWNLRQGVLTEAELKTKLDGLEDSQGNAGRVNLVEGGSRSESRNQSSDFSSNSEPSVGTGNNGFGGFN